jgi:hypothetical protein
VGCEELHTSLFSNSVTVSNRRGAVEQARPGVRYGIGLFLESPQAGTLHECRSGQTSSQNRANGPWTKARGIEYWITSATGAKPSQAKPYLGLEFQSPLSNVLRSRDSIFLLTDPLNHAPRSNASRNNLRVRSKLHQPTTSILCKPCATTTTFHPHPLATSLLFASVGRRRSQQSRSRHCEVVLRDGVVQEARPTGDGGCRAS